MIAAIIPGFGNKYKIHNDGRVFNINTHRLLKQDFSARYARVTLFEKGKPKKYLVHRLVAENFIPNPFDKREVNHKDLDILNNHFSNLEWVSSIDNIRHACFNGKRVMRGVSQYDLKGNLLNTFQFISEASKCLGVDRSSITRCCKHRQKTSGSYVFEYTETNWNEKKGWKE